MTHPRNSNRFSLHVARCFAVSLLLIAVGCDGNTDGSGRGPIGKADLVGTCAGACGGPSTGNCFCDDVCSDFGDCCTDYASECTAAPDAGVPETSACEEAGGSCVLPSPDGCGADAESVDLACELANDFCCVPVEVPEESACEAAGGSCVLPSPDGCGADAESVDLACELANDFCCVPVEQPEESACEAAGGSCVLPSPDGCGADAELVDLACELANDFCCVPG